MLELILCTFSRYKTLVMTFLHIGNSSRTGRYILYKLLVRCGPTTFNFYSQEQFFHSHSGRLVVIFVLLTQKAV